MPYKISVSPSFQRKQNHKIPENVYVLDPHEVKGESDNVNERIKSIHQKKRQHREHQLAVIFH